jgi:hypothetical protein
MGTGLCMTCSVNYPYMLGMTCSLYYPCVHAVYEPMHDLLSIVPMYRLGLMPCMTYPPYPHLMTLRLVCRLCMTCAWPTLFIVSVYRLDLSLLYDLPTLLSLCAGCVWACAWPTLSRIPVQRLDTGFCLYCPCVRLHMSMYINYFLNYPFKQAG